MINDENVSVIISYCSLERRFIEPLLREVSKFADEIILTTYDRLIVGDREPIEELTFLAGFSECETGLLVLPAMDLSDPKYFHNHLRHEGFKYSRFSWLLFLDGDEIPDGDNFRALFDSGLLREFDAVSFACYWYFRSAKFRAKTLETCALLCRREIINPQVMYTSYERRIFEILPGIKFVGGMCLSKGPILHHYSWVRTKEEMLKKVAWGHQRDKDWRALIEKEFSSQFQGIDFVHGYSYDTVTDIFNIGL